MTQIIGINNNKLLMILIITTIIINKLMDILLKNDQFFNINILAIIPNPIIPIII